MKLLIINGHLNTGGVERSLIDILQHLDYERYEVDLLLLEGLGDYAPLLPPQVHVSLKCLKNTYGPWFSSVLNCIRQRDWLCLKMKFIFLITKFLGQDKIFLAKHLLTDGKQYDYVIGYRRGICTQIASFAVDADRRFSWWHHGSVNVKAAQYLDEVSRCDKIAVVSDAVCRTLGDEIPELKPKLIVVPNMVDQEKVHIQSAADDPYKNKNILHIVSVGGLVPEKHFQNAIYAANVLKGEGVPFQWHLVGGGVMEEELRGAAASAGVSDVFCFEGNQTNPYPYLKHADLFVHPSYVESQGIVILEAMTLGVPCVVTKSLGPCEFIEDGVNGILTDQSPESLTEKVLEILRDRQLYERIRANTHCPEQFTPENVMQLFYKFIGD